MTRKPRRPSYLQGHYYHIYNRGVGRASIFREDENYFFVLKRIKKYSRELQLTLIAYCLMPNHYHFLVRQDGEQSAGSLPQRVFNSYTKAYNKRYGHSGTLFDHDFVETFFVTAADYQEFVQDYLIMRELPLELERYLEDY